MRTPANPWTLEEYDSFIKLGERIGVATVSDRLQNAFLHGGLGRLPPPQSFDYETLDDAWKARRDHAVYKWLSGNENFLAAWTTFQKHRRKPKNEKIADPIADLQFLRMVVHCAGWCFISQQRGTTKFTATAPHRRSALKHSRSLTRLFQKGVRLGDSAKQAQLEAHLLSLESELAARARKNYEGPRMTGTRALEFLALELVIDFGLRSPSIVQDVANMVGLSRERTTCEKYVKEADERWRSAFADALQSHLKTAKT